MNRGQYLAHYGVLGMKWGVRKNPEYSYTSRLTKKYGRKADKYAAKGNAAKAAKYRSMQERSATLDKRQEEYSKRVTTKGNLICRALTGGIVGGTSYTRMLSAMGGQGAGNRGKKAAAAVLSYWGGWPASRIMNAMYVRGKINESDFSANSVRKRANELGKKVGL